MFLEGHGERSPLGQANFDLGQFGQELKRKGVNLALLNLAKTPDIPANTTALVIAGPRANLLPGEVGLIQDYVKKGGNLLWLADPGDQHGLQALAEQLNLTFLPGTVVDASTQLFGIDDPTFALVAEYVHHPITADFKELTLFPVAAALQSGKDADFHATAVLRTLARSWTEIGPLKGDIRFNADSGEKEGPLTIGYAWCATCRRPPPRLRKARPNKPNPANNAFSCWATATSCPTPTWATAATSTWA
ncbi:Gldg family protein [Methylogaea oryzae]|uniref:Gldg family protein n=1 Tax=Methylogaea oryzae TaxID=1295382 RepID=UPI003BB50FD3